MILPLMASSNQQQQFVSILIIETCKQKQKCWKSITYSIQAFQVSAEYEKKKSLRNEREAGGP